MKKILFFCVLVFCALYPQAKENEYKVKDSFYKNGYSEVFTIDNSGVYASKVFNFPDASQEELKNRVSKYFNQRIERRLNDEDVNSQNSSFLDDVFFVSESTPAIKINLLFYAYGRYTYKIEIKEGKIRATIFLNSWYWGNNFPYVNPFKLYPFCSGGGYEKAFKSFYEYVKSVWESLPKDLYKDNEPLLDDNW